MYKIYEVKIMFKNPVTAVSNYFDPATAINLNYSKAECQGYIRYTTCAVKAHTKGGLRAIQEECPFPTFEQFEKCSPIDPKVVTFIRRTNKEIDEKTGYNLARPLVTSTSFANIYRAGTHPNPN